MINKAMIALAAGTGMILAAPIASAKPSGGIWSDNSPSKKSSPKPKSSEDKATKTAPVEPVPGEAAAAANADADVAPSPNASDQARVNSQGPANANVEAIARANENSVLAAGAVAASDLPGLTTGLTVKTSAGASLGTVSQVVTGDDGSIRLVVVTAADGKTYRLTPDQLSIAGGVVTTAQTDLDG